MKIIPVTILALCVLALLVCAASASVLSIENGQVAAIGSTATVNIVLDEATAGLSGYSINVSVGNPGVATISSVTYPSWASLTETSTLPSANVKIKASDAGEKVQSGATNVPIATVTLQGLAGGTTPVNLVVNMMNDDSDATMAPTISAGTFTVDVPIEVPVAAFTATPTSGDLPLTVAFTDQSTNAPTSWAWDFGDGATSTDKNPSHQYTTAGIFTVTLTATNAAGSDSEEKTGFITVIPDPPIANFAKNVSSGLAPLSVQFTDTSTGGDPTSWAWDFQNDGFIDSNEENPVFVYTVPGTYSINLTVANLGGISSKLKENQITVTAPPAPVAAFISDVQSGVAPLTVTFTDQSTNTPTSWAWTFGDGGTSDQQNPSHQYTAAGTYTVKLTATNDGGSDDEEKTGFIVVTSTPVAPVAAFTSDVTSGTAPLTVNFTDQSTNGPTSWAWTFGDGDTSDQQSPSHQYTAAGTYTVKLTATNAGGSDDEEKIGYITASAVTVAPVAGFTSDIQNGTAPLTVNFTDQSTNSPTSWAWTFGDGGTSDQQNPSHQYTAAGNYTVNLTATNVAGSDSEEKIDYITVTAAPVVAPIADFTVSPNTPTTGVVPLFIRFNDISTNVPTSWLWDFGDGGMSTEQNATHTYMVAGTYTVTLTATNAGGGDSEVKTGFVTVAAGSGNGGLANSAWPKLSFDLNASSQSPNIGPQTASLKWMLPLGSEVIYNRGGVAIGTDGTLYTGGGNGTLYAVNPDGTVKWSYSVDTLANGGNSLYYDQIPCTPAIAADGTIYFTVSANLRYLVAMNPDGTQKWRYQATKSSSANIMGSPTVGPGGEIYFGDAVGSSSGYLYAIRPDGTLNWSYNVGPVQATPLVGQDGTIYVSNKKTSSSYIYAINPDGSKKWSTTVSARTADMVMGPVDQIIYASSSGTTGLRAITPGTSSASSITIYPGIGFGSDTGGASLAVGKDGTVYGEGGSTLYAITPDASNATLKWSYTSGGNIYPSTPAIGSDGTVYFGSDDGKVYALNSDGTLKWSYTTSGIVKGAPTIGPDSTLYIKGLNGLYAFQDPDAAPPVAAFTSDVQSGTAPLTVNFTDQSTNTPTAWAWDFGDGSTSTDQNPVHQFTTAGTYNVSLTATNVGGSDTETKAGFITVSPVLAPPVTAFTATPTAGISPLSIQFSDQSTGSPTAWSWDFGDGNTSTEQNPSHIYSTSGSYTVTLTATNADGSDSATKAGYIQIFDPSHPTVLVTPQVLDVPIGTTGTYTLSITSLPSGIAGYNLSVSLADPAAGEITALTLPAWAALNTSSAVPGDSAWLSGLDLARNVEAGATNVPLGTVSVRGDAIGSSPFVVTVSEMDADGGEQVNPAVVNGMLNVYQPVPVAADFSADNTTGKLPFTVRFTDLSTGDPVPTAWNWDFGDGVISTEQNPTHTYTSGGQFTVTLTASSTYSQDTVTKANYITVTRHVVPFPGCVNEPLDPDLDGRYEDINGNGRLDFDDIVTLYENMQWVRDNTEVGTEPFDFNGNGRLDYDDIVLLYYEVLAG